MYTIPLVKGCQLGCFRSTFKPPGHENLLGSYRVTDFHNHFILQTGWGRYGQADLCLNRNLPELQSKWSTPNKWFSSIYRVPTESLDPRPLCYHSGCQSREGLALFCYAYKQRTSREPNTEPAATYNPKMAVCLFLSFIDYIFSTGRACMRLYAMDREPEFLFL